MYNRRPSTKSLLVATALVAMVSTSCGLADPPADQAWQEVSFDWPVSTPSEQGMDNNVLEEALTEASRRTFVRSLLVVRNGFLVAEAYFSGGHQHGFASTYSVTKSITSALVGLALYEGYIDSIDQRMLDFFPEYDNPDDERKNDITIRHLLTMQSGYDEETRLSSEVDTATNTIAAIIQSDLQFDPGSEFLYSTHSTHLLSAIVLNATGMNSVEYAKARLMRPIGIDSIIWTTDYNGITYGGAGLWMTPRDMARLGYLYLRGGRLNGRQVLPADWIDLSTQNHRSQTGQWDEMVDVGYGFLWWTGEIQSHSVFFASGYGGQWILVVPAIDMVVVSTTNAYSESRNFEQAEYLIELMDLYILPSIVN